MLGLSKQELEFSTEIIFFFFLDFLELKKKKEYEMTMKKLRWIDI